MRRPGEKVFLSSREIAAVSAAVGIVLMNAALIAAQAIQTTGAA